MVSAVGFGQAFAQEINASSDQHSNAQLSMDEIHTVEVFEVNEDNNLVVPPVGDISLLGLQETKKPNKSIGNALLIGKDLIAFGEELYRIVEAGKPVLTIGEQTPISVLPRNNLGVNISSFDLTGWQEPRVKKFKIVAKNGFGSTMVSLEIMLMFSYGGSFEGKGAFISDAEISVTDVEVFWGYSLGADFKVKSILNQGTKGNPIAATMLQVTYSMKSLLKETRSTKKFLINGLGKVKTY